MVPAMIAEPVGGGEGLALTSEAFARTAASGMGLFAPELGRIRGALPAGRGDGTGAEADFLRAVDVARKQEAKHWDLRAATGLAGIWRDRGRRAEARDFLVPVHGWFTDGFGLPDLLAWIGASSTEATGQVFYRPPAPEVAMPTPAQPPRPGPTGSSPHPWPWSTRAVAC